MLSLRSLTAAADVGVPLTVVASASAPLPSATAPAAAAAMTAAPTFLTDMILLGSLSASSPTPTHCGVPCCAEAENAPQLPGDANPECAIGRGGGRVRTL